MQVKEKNFYTLLFLIWAFIAFLAAGIMSSSENVGVTLRHVPVLVLSAVIFRWLPSEKRMPYLLFMPWVLFAIYSAMILAVDTAYYMNVIRRYMSSWEGFLSKLQMGAEFLFFELLAGYVPMLFVLLPLKCWCSFSNSTNSRSNS